MASTYSTSTLSQADRKNLKRPDSFTTATVGFFDQLFSHFRGVTLAILCLFLIGLGGAYYSNHREAQSQEARNILYLATKSLEKESKVIPGQDKDPSVALFQKLNTDAQFAETIKTLKKVDESFGGTRSAFESRLKLGDLYLNHGEAEKALPWYEKAIQSAPDNLDKALAFSALAYAQENLGKHADALLSYQKGINLGESSVKGDLLLGIARCYEVLHDSANARKSYDQILSEFPNTDYSRTAEAYRAQL